MHALIFFFFFIAAQLTQERFLDYKMSLSSISIRISFRNCNSNVVTLT